MAENEIAIVGAGCRFPGADNLDEFWQVLVKGENHVTDIPESRWNNAAFYDEDKTVPGKSYVRKAGLLKNHGAWDNRLFGISDAEASRVDPQQRYVLECVHMALEDGGITRKHISGTKTGVIIGCMNDDYKVLAQDDLTDVGSYNATGTATSVISARVSYVYNLHGTCLTLDTACSSALVAIHLACQAIKTGDCDMVICGGVSSILAPDVFVTLCKARMMSATGQCQSFCDTADGYARGEGCGIVILKGLKAAIEDGNIIWGTIQTGSNHDGCTTKPMTAPSGVQQLELLKQVYHQYQCNPSDIQYIEAHGTGTPIGDPTELNALGLFFSPHTKTSDRRLLVGSVKSNIGHTESAAGIAGLLKVLLMMKHGKYVPSLHVKHDKSNINKTIELDKYNIDIVTSVQDWSYDMAGQRHACLNSFGFGGSNTHAIVTQKKKTEVDLKRDGVQAKILPISISGIDEASLKLNISQFCKDLDDGLFNLEDVAFTSFNHRDVHPARTLVFGKDIFDIKDNCKKKLDRLNEVHVSPRKNHNKIFVYCGVGTTWTGMCQEMMQQNETFSKAIDQIDKHLPVLTGWKIGDKFLTETDYSDPYLNHIAIFCVQVALTEVWKSFGVSPDIIVGQSVGEVAAAYAANLLTLSEAVKIIHHRSEVLSRQSEGSMTVIANFDVKQVEHMCARYDGPVCIAVYSSPVACTISGTRQNVDKLTHEIQAKGEQNVFIRELKVKCAYHSSVLDSCIKDVQSRIDTSLVDPSHRIIDDRNSIPMISTVTGKPFTQTEARSGTYWAENIRQPVLFMQSIKQAFGDDCCNIYVEIGPRPVLKAHISNIFGSSNQPLTIPSMITKTEIKCFYGSLAEIVEIGVDIRLPMTDGIQKNQVTRIPRYIFARKENLFFPNTVIHTLAGFETGKDGSHMFVQTLKRANDRDFLVCIDEISTPFVYDHFISDRIIVPGATYAETGFHVGVELFNVPVDKLSVAIDFVKTFTPSTGRQHKLKVQLDSRSSEYVRFSILNDIDVLSTGKVSKRNTFCREPLDIDDLKDQCPVHKTKSDSYDALKSFNFRYGDSLSLINRSWVSDTTSKCLTEIHLPERVFAELIKTHLHPTIIDSMFQIFGILVKKSIVGGETFAIPKGVASVVLNKPVESVMYGYGEEIHSTSSTRHFNAVLLSKEGIVIAEMENFFIQMIANDTVFSQNQLKYTLNWSEVQESWVATSPVPERVVVISNAPQSDWLLEFGKAVTILHTNEKELDAIFNESSVNTVFLYHVAGKYNDRTPNRDKRVFAEVLKNFFKLKKVLTVLKQTKLNKPVTIITENTQSCPERHRVNYEGSELWGMIRSAVHEGFYNDIKLVDIDKDNIDIPTVLAVLARPGESESGLEYALSGSKLYQPKLQADSRAVRSKRRIALTTSERFAIYNDNPIEITQPYLMLANETEVNPDALPVSLKSITVHNKSMYLPALYDIKQIDLTLQTQGSEDCQVIALEGRGTIEDTNRDVVFLYPVNAETTVNIPKKYIIEEKDCPVYMSGILILTNMLVHIASVIKCCSSVMVLKETEMIDVGQALFISIMKRRSCKIQFCTNKQLQTMKTYSHIHTLITLTRMSVGKLKKVLRSFTNLTNIVSLSMLFPEYLKLWLIHRHPSLQITVLSTMELLSAKGIEATIPVIKDCLQAFRPGSISKTTSFFLIQLPMKDISILANLHDGSLECFCDKLNMFRPQACYIVVGGLTGLGWELLQVMAKNGASILITLSRREPSNAIKDKIVEVESTYPCRVIPMQADISDINSVENAFLQIFRQFPHHPIKGIFHGAGVLADSLLQNLDEGKIIDVIKPKVLGVWNLHSVSLNLPIDYFVVHSSVVSVIGNAGQSHYAAANSFLDSFALYRRSKGLPAQSINWGALSVGMASESEEVKSQLERKGFRSIEKDIIWDLFFEALANDTTNIIYADIDWETIWSNSTFIKQASKYSNLYSAKLRISHSKNHKQFDIEGFRKLDLTDQTAKIKAALREIIHEVFVAENDSLTDGTSFSDIGIDSMSAMSLSNAIDDTFGCRISVVTLLSGETSLTTLTENVLQDLNKSPEIKNVSHQTDIDQIQEFQDYFKSENITFMQMDFLHKYKQNRENPHFLFVVDIELIHVSFTKVEWNGILKHVLTLNPELRKRYVFPKTGDVSVEKIVVDCEPSVDIVSVGDFSQEKSKSSDPRMSLSTDIHNSPLISFKIADTDKNTLLRLIIHAASIDMRGLSMLCQDIEITCLSVANGVDLPSPRPVIDICGSVKKAIMPRMADLSDYWDKCLNFSIKPVTLGTKLQTIDPKYCKIVYVDVPYKKANAIQKYIAVLGISLYEFIMSLYQLYLFIGSNSPIIPVGTAADMRFHVPELNHVITRCVNYIPVIAHIDEKYTIKKFIEENSIKLSNTTRNGAFPSSLIVKKIQAVEVKENVFRHFLSMNDLKRVNKIQEENSRVQVRKVWIARPDRETFIYVRYDLTKASIQFEMGHNTEICSHYGDKFTDILLQLVDEAILFGSKSIGKVRDEIIGSQARGDSNRIANIDDKDSEGTTVFQSTVMKDKCNTQIHNAQEKTCIPTEDDHSESKMKSRCSEKEMAMKTSVTENGKCEGETKDTIITDIFEKQTTRGWDHTVEVTLNMVNENRILLEWGKERRVRKKTHRTLDLRNVKSIAMTKINGLSSLILDTDDRKLIFKTPNRLQAERWIELIQLAFRRIIQTY